MRKKGDLDNALVRIDALRQHMEASVIQRQPHIRAILRGLAHGKANLLFLGDKGTAKTSLVQVLGESIKGFRFIDKLMMRDQGAGEVFGYTNPLLVAKAGQPGGPQSWADCLDTSDAIQAANLYFMDEPYKAGVILNRNLQVMANRRMSFAGRKWDLSNLFLVVGASNETPENNPDVPLEAFHDRWYETLEVRYVNGRDDKVAMMKARLTPMTSGNPSLDDIILLRDARASVVIPDEIRYLMVDAAAALAEKGIIISDRRLCQTQGLVQAQALLEGRMEATAQDFADIADSAFINDLRERPTVTSVVGKMADPVGAKVQAIMDIAEKMYREVVALDPTSDKDAFRIKAIKAMEVMDQQEGELDALRKSHPRNARVAQAFQTIEGWHLDISARFRASVKARV